MFIQLVFITSDEHKILEKQVTYEAEFWLKYLSNKLKSFSQVLRKLEWLDKCSNILHCVACFA